MSSLPNSAKISICMCTYNGERFLREQLDSIVDQTLPPDEIVISDDGSHDQTMGILSEYSLKYPGQFSISQNAQNLGFKKNFNGAFARTHGLYVFFVDQDDVWSLDKIEKTLKVFENKPSINCVCGKVSLIDEKGQSLGEWSSFNKNMRQLRAQKKQWKRYFLLHTINGTDMAVRRSFAEQFVPLPPQMGHDEWLTVASCAYNSCFFLPETMVYYRKHENELYGPDSAVSFQNRFRYDPDLNGTVRRLKLMASDIGQPIPAQTKQWAQDCLSFLENRQMIRAGSRWSRVSKIWKGSHHLAWYFRYCPSPLLSILKDLYFKSEAKKAD